MDLFQRSAMRSVLFGATFRPRYSITCSRQLYGQREKTLARSWLFSFTRGIHARPTVVGSERCPSLTALVASRSACWRCCVLLWEAQIVDAAMECAERARLSCWSPHSSQPSAHRSTPPRQYERGLNALSAYGR